MVCVWCCVWLSTINRLFVVVIVVIYYSCFCICTTITTTATMTKLLLLLLLLLLWERKLSIFSISRIASELNWMNGWMNEYIDKMHYRWYRSLYCNCRYSFSAFVSRINRNVKKNVPNFTNIKPMHTPPIAPPLFSK